MIRNELYRDALRRLEELRDMKVIYVSDGSPGSDKVAQLVTFAQAVIPDLITAIEAWFTADGTDPQLEAIRFEMAMNVLKMPVDQGVLHMMESLRGFIDD